MFTTLSTVLLGILCFAGPTWGQTANPGAFPHRSNASIDGNDLLQKCTSLWAEGPFNPGDNTQRLDAGFCAGYVAGVTDSDAMWKAVEGKTSKSIQYCMPEAVTNGQILRIIKKWLDDNPEKLHWRADLIIHIKLVEAIPCKYQLAVLGTTGGEEITTDSRDSLRGAGAGWQTRTSSQPTAPQA